MLDVAGLSPIRPQEQGVESMPLLAAEPEHALKAVPQEQGSESKPMPAGEPERARKAVPEPHASPEPVTVARASNRLRIPALATLGAGAVCLAVGGGLFATSGNARTDVSHGVVRVFSDDANKVAGILRSQTAGVALLGVGAGLAAVGAGLLLFGPTDTTTAVVPINGGAAVLMTGRLP